jgi:hypothetical protein
MNSPPMNNPQRPPQNAPPLAPKLDPVDDVVKADDSLFRMIPVPHDTERLEVEAGLSQFLYPVFGGVIRKCRDERFGVFQRFSSREARLRAKARLASGASGSEANRAALNRAYEARRTTRNTISPRCRQSGRLGDYSDAARRRLRRARLSAADGSSGPTFAIAIVAIAERDRG